MIFSFVDQKLGQTYRFYFTSYYISISSMLSEHGYIIQRGALLGIENSLIMMDAEVIDYLQLTPDFIQHVNRIMKLLTFV